MHIIGEIKCGLGFGDGVSCKWKIDHGKHWGILDGFAYGHTQTAYGSEGLVAVWNHPVDLVYQTTSMQGWPKLLVQIQQLDEFGRVQVIAHGFAHIPSTPGAHEVTVSCWRATGRATSPRTRGCGAAGTGSSTARTTRGTCSSRWCLKRTASRP